MVRDFADARTRVGAELQSLSAFREISVLRSTILALLFLIQFIPAGSAYAQWTIIHGKNNAVTRNVPGEMSKTAADVRRRGGVLKSIAFAPGGGWVMLYNKNDLLARGIPDDAYQALTEKANRGAELKSIAFTPDGGWVVLFDKNGHVESKIPDEASSKLRELAEQGADLKSVGFAPSGGWVVLYGMNALFARNIPEEAYQAMIDPGRKNTELRCAAFHPLGGWALLFEKGLVVSENLPGDVQKSLTDLQKRKSDLRWVAFDPHLVIPFAEDEEQSRAAILERMRHHKVPGLGIALIDDGKLQWARGYGVLHAGQEQAVNDQTRFQAASISKPVAALAALRFVQQGKLKLDADVNGSLTSWKVPDTPLTRRKPPLLRQVLSHTAGFTVHGFGGYPRGEPVPTLKQILDGEPPANSEAIRIELAPGTKWQYSGGGYCVLQQLLEDVSGKSFPELMREQALQPVGMSWSSFDQSPGEEEVAHRSTAHTAEGEPIAGNWHVYPEMAAAGLWTTPRDLALFVIALSQAHQGKGEAILQPTLIKAMLAPQPQSDGFGLGLAIAGKGKTLSFSHGGSNAGFRCHLIGFPAAGKGAVVMTNSDSGDRLIHEVATGLRMAYDWPE